MSYTKTIHAPAKLTGGTVSHTGTTTETKVFSVLIPANTLAANDSFDCTGLIGGDGSGTKTYRIYVNTTDDLTGSPVYLGLYSFTTNSTNTSFGRAIFSANSISSWNGINNSTSANSTFVTNNTTPTAYTIDFSVNQYFIVTIQLATSTNNTYIYGLRSAIYR